jgi:glucosamine kinase
VTKDIFIGIDGGGTKTKVRVEHSDGQLIGQAVSGPSNIRLSVDKAWQSIYHAISEVLNSAAISLEDKNYHFHVGMGLAGCEVADIRHDFLSRPHPFTTLELNSDAHTACVGAHGGKEGAIIIVGTGVVGYQIQAGKGTKVSGWGFPHDDEGGGAWLGLEAVRLTFQWIDHRTERSPLVEDIFSYFNSSLEQFVSWSNRANSTEFAKLAPLVINHSQQEEIAAVRLMKKAAHAIDRVGVALAKTQTKPLQCSLFGGIAPFLEPWLSDELRETLVAREGDANVGAVLMVREAVKNPSRNTQKKEVIR